MGYRITPFIRWFSPWKVKFLIVPEQVRCIHIVQLIGALKWYWWRRQNCLWSPISDQQPLVVCLVHWGLYSQCSPSLEDCLIVNLSPAMYKKDCQNVGFWIPHRIHWTGILIYIFPLQSTILNVDRYASPFLSYGYYWKVAISLQIPFWDMESNFALKVGASQTCETEVKVLFVWGCFNAPLEHTPKPLPTGHKGVLFIVGQGDCLGCALGVCGTSLGTWWIFPWTGANESLGCYGQMCILCATFFLGIWV